MSVSILFLRLFKKKIFPKMLTEKDQIKALKELESLKAEIKVLHK